MLRWQSDSNVEQRPFCWCNAVDRLWSSGSVDFMLISWSHPGWTRLCPQDLWTNCFRAMLVKMHPNSKASHGTSSICYFFLRPRLCASTCEDMQEWRASLSAGWFTGTHLSRTLWHQSHQRPRSVRNTPRRRVRNKATKATRWVSRCRTAGEDPVQDHEKPWFFTVVMEKWWKMEVYSWENHVYIFIHGIFQLRLTGG